MKTTFKIGAISIPTEVEGKVVTAKVEGIELSLEDLSVRDLISLMAIVPEFLHDLKGAVDGTASFDDEEIDFPFPGGAMPLFSGILGKKDELEGLFKDEKPEFDFEKIVKGTKSPFEGLAGLGKPGVIPGLGQGGMFAIDASKLQEAGPLGDILKAIIEAKRNKDK